MDEWNIETAANDAARDIAALILQKCKDLDLVHVQIDPLPQVKIANLPRALKKVFRSHGVEVFAEGADGLTLGDGTRIVVYDARRPLPNMREVKAIIRVVVHQ